MGESLSYRFQLEGFDCDWFKSALAAQPHIGNTDYAAVISDIRLPDISGSELFRRLQSENRTLPPFLFITGFANIGDAVDLLKQGAADYITKPFDLDTLMGKLRDLCRGQEVDSNCGKPTLGVSASMRAVEQTLCRLASHEAAVLITGESGVGKEHAARFLHHCTFGDSGRPFVAVNCGAIPEGLMEAELFGHEKGAFTGAVRARRGVFERADRGTLFLDEIGDMPLSMQVRLLRVIQERRVLPVGSETPIAFDVRLVCATHRDLTQMVTDGTFREDLYYRINVVHVALPPLRSRREDILWFTRRFLREIDPDRYLLPSAEQRLLDQEWPGNLRELHHAIERACILCPEPGIGAAAFDDGDDQGENEGNLRTRLTRYEHQLIVETLERHDYQIAESARELGISRKNLWEKMKKLGIEKA